MPKITHTKFEWRCDVPGCTACAETVWAGPPGWVESLSVGAVVGADPHMSNVVACGRAHAIEAARARFEAMLEEALRSHFHFKRVPPVEETK